jgi:hypothetical protein
MSSIWLSVRAAAIAVVVVVLAAACGDGDDGASVAFSDPADGAAVAGGVDVTMTAAGVTIEEAGEVREDAGHFHVIADAGCVEPGAAVSRGADHLHFGGGQSEGTIYLNPGSHDLCLQVGDGAHVALDATDTITVEVGIDDRDDWCAVVDEVDELFDATDNSSEEFAAKQVSYENIGRLLAQLEDGLDQVDAAARQAVATSVGWAVGITDAMVTATDAQDAERLLESAFAASEGESGAGAPWILDNCGIDIDG